MPTDGNASAVHTADPSVNDLLEAAALLWVAENPRRFAELCRTAVGVHCDGLATTENPFLPLAERAFHQALGL